MMSASCPLLSVKSYNLGSKHEPIFTAENIASKHWYTSHSSAKLLYSITHSINVSGPYYGFNTVLWKLQRDINKIGPPL